MLVRYELPSLLDVLPARLLLEVQFSVQICQVSRHLRLPCQCLEFQDKQRLGHPALFPVAEDSADSTFVQLAHMAGSLIMAYAFDLGKSDDTDEEADEDGFVEDDEEDPEKGMVPLADMLNADADRNNVSGSPCS